MVHLTLRNLVNNGVFHPGLQDWLRSNLTHHLRRGRDCYLEHKDETSTRWQLNRDGFLWRDSPSRGKSVFLQTDLQLHVDPTPVPQNVQAQGQAPAQDPVQEQDQNDQAPVQGQAPAQAPVQEQDQNAQAQDQAPKTPMHKFAEEEGGRRDLNNQSVALLGSNKKECPLKKFFCFVESAEDEIVFYHT